MPDDIASAHSAPLRLDYDVGRIEALAQERAQEWSRIDAATFLTQDEKREAAGYGNLEGTKACAGCVERRYRPDQARDDHGKCVDEGRQHDSSSGAGGLFAASADCASEWAHANMQCEIWLSMAFPPRSLTGGYKDVYNCARGLVSQECGGNAVSFRRR